jgi:hypothetical protein
MPFTFSHPAVIIPLLYARQRYPWLSATGLIAGSIAPDFEKFFRLKLASHYSHTIASIFYFSCPVAVGLSFVFHLLVRQQLLAHVPAALYQRVGQYRFFNWPSYFRQHYMGVLLSIIIGAASHLIWDSFTHTNTVVTRVVPDLDNAVWLGERAVPFLHLLAAASSLAGGVAIAWAVWMLPVRLAGPVPSKSALYRYWGITILVAAALEVEWILLFHPRLLNMGITAISAIMVGIITASVYTGRKNTG